MKLKHKLISGYAIALGVASIGVLNGVWLGNQQHQRALLIHQQASKEQQILNQLQVGVLYNQPSKQFFPYLESSEKLQQQSQALLTRLQAIQVTLVEYEASNQSEAILSELPLLLPEFKQIVDELLPRAETFVEAIASVPDSIPATAPDSIPATAPDSIPDPDTAVGLRRQLLLDLIRSQEFRRFMDFPDQLFPLNQRANEYEAIASLALQQAERLRTQVILLSLALSIGISSILSWYLSRSIAQPLAAVTQTAQQVTRDENFDLRVTVNSDDEVGTVAIALNQLIERVGTLLEQQRESASMQELFQNEKMASLGKMVSEVAHEINNPVNSICGNLSHAQHYVDDLIALLHTYDQVFPHPPDTVQAQAEAIDRPFLEKDLPKLLKSMEKGANRTRQIALSLRNFSRLDASLPTQVHLHTCLDDTLLILSGRLKQGITVQQQYGDVPPIEGYAGPLYQVFTNLIGNAIDALVDAKIEQPQITIKTAVQDQFVTVSLVDNGPGIHPDHLNHIFDALFTTKPVGMGTGLGLAISRQIVEEKHGGRLTCQSSLGTGTTFQVALPLYPTVPQSVGSISPTDQLEAPPTQVLWQESALSDSSSSQFGDTSPAAALHHRTSHTHQ
ncbi:MAG: HAMP domain-containing histidine kinase [Cyanothece sp. SIO2G6]|nr:HAMP domain-containing histidine kinase [Cyanothece sp. SIO2G6]